MIEPWMSLVAMVLAFVAGWFFGHDRGWDQAVDDLNRLMREQEEKAAK